MQIVYKKLTSAELDTFISMRITQLTEEYINTGRKIPENVDMKSALKDYYLRHMKDGTFVSWISKELLSRVVEEAKAYGCGAVHITASDMGVKLYSAYGFKHNGNFMQYTFYQ